MSKAKRAIVPVALCVALGWIGWTSGQVATDEPADRYKVTVTVTTTCTEDMACWDCATMGNRICGPNS